MQQTTEKETGFVRPVSCLAAEKDLNSLVTREVKEQYVRKRLSDNVLVFRIGES